MKRGMYLDRQHIHVLWHVHILEAVVTDHLPR